jgi:hypothetical protein
MKTILTRLIGVALVWALTAVDVWAQCAMCRGSVESSIGNGRNNVGMGLNTGIMYLFVMPYLIVAVIAFLWYRNSKKLQAERRLVTARVRNAMGGGH